MDNVIYVEFDHDDEYNRGHWDYEPVNLEQIDDEINGQDKLWEE